MLHWTVSMQLHLGVLNPSPHSCYGYLALTGSKNPKPPHLEPPRTRFMMSEPHATAPSPAVPIEAPKDWTDGAIQDALAYASTLKAEGNAYFTSKNWANAIIAYRQALDALPRVPEAPKASDKGKGRAAIDDDEDGDDIVPPTDSEEPIKPLQEAEEKRKRILTPLEKECATVRVVLWSNTAQCHLKMVGYAPPILSPGSRLTITLVRKHGRTQ